MWLLSWILIGLIMGAIARAVLPGRANGGWVVSLVIGIVGAIVGGFIGRNVFNANPNDHFFSLATWFWAFIGSLIVLAIWGALSRKNH